jgi:hypothetical protein
MEEEIWKDIMGYEGLYQISNLGRVKSLIKNIINKSIKNKQGYLSVTLCKNNIRKTYRNHRLAGIHFIEVDMGLIENLEINHKDGNPQNNNIRNLEWINKRENNSHNKLNKVYTSKFIGVFWREINKKFTCGIKINNKDNILGYSINEIDCAETYLEFCKNNNIENKYAFEIYNNYCIENNIENKFILQPNKRDWINKLKLEADNKKSSTLYGVSFRKERKAYISKLTFSIGGEKAKEHLILYTKSEHEAGKAILDKLLSLGRNEITDALAFQKYNEYCKINNIENTYPIPNFKI